MNRLLRRTLTLIVVGLAALRLTAVVHAETRPRKEPPMVKGFALGTSIGVTPMHDDALVWPSIFFGYRGHYATIGLGFEYTSHTGERSFAADGYGGRGTATSSSFSIFSAAQISPIRFLDGNAELVFGLAFGAGKAASEGAAHNVFFGDDGYSSSFNESWLVAWRGGPGARIWLHPHFALGLVAGVSGRHTFIETSAPGAELKDQTSVSPLVEFGFLGVL